MQSDIFENRQIHINMTSLHILAILAIIQVSSKQVIELARSEPIEVHHQVQDQAHRENELHTTSTTSQTGIFGEGNKINDGESSSVILQMKRRLPGKTIVSSLSNKRAVASAAIVARTGSSRRRAGKNLNILPLFPEYPEELALKKQQFFSNSLHSSSPHSFVSPSLSLDFSDTRGGMSKGHMREDENGNSNLFPNEIESHETNDSKRWPFFRLNDKHEDNSVGLDLRLAVKLPEDIEKFDP